MTWFKVDDDLAFHRKAVSAGNAAMGLWVRAGAWCSQQLSDGRIPHEIARTMGKPSEIKALVRAELWEIDGNSYVFHDYFDRNPSRAEVEERRAAEAKKKSDWRAKRAGQQGLSTGDTTGDSQVSSPGESPGESRGESLSSRPDPTRPGTSNEVPTTKPRKRSTPPPADIEITDAMLTWAKTKAAGVDLGRETERFLDHHRSKGTVMSDWTAGWRTWMSRATEYGSVRQIKPNSRDGMTKQRQLPSGRWTEVSVDEVLYGVRTEWRPAL